MSSPSYGLALCPDDGFGARYARIRERLDPRHAALTVPHITVVQTFFLGALPDEAALLSVLTERCARHATFEVTLHGVGTFVSHAYGAVVYVRVVPSPELLALAHTLVRAVHSAGCVGSPAHDAEAECRLFFPHLTLAQGLTSDAAHAAASSLEDLPRESFTARSVVVGRCEHGRWLRPHTVPLGTPGR